MKRIRIGNGCGFWGDNVDAPVLLAERGGLDYLTLEYLAELTMSILAVQRRRCVTRAGPWRTTSPSYAGNTASAHALDSLCSSGDSSRCG